MASNIKPPAIPIRETCFEHLLRAALGYKSGWIKNKPHTWKLSAALTFPKPPCYPIPPLGITAPSNSAILCWKRDPRLRGCLRIELDRSAISRNFTNSCRPGATAMLISDLFQLPPAFCCWIPRADFRLRELAVISAEFKMARALRNGQSRRCYLAECHFWRVLWTRMGPRYFCLFFISTFTNVAYVGIFWFVNYRSARK